MNQTADERRKNVKKRITAASLLAAILFALPAMASQRHRPARPPVSDVTPAGWLLNHAYPYAEAIASAARPATMIGLGDDTHGTHEYFDVKLRMIQKLVREEDFRLIAFEGPFADFNRLDDYVLGGTGDPRTILRRHELGYWFWASNEIVAVIDWVREYNATRGDKPAVEIAGMDVTDTQGAADMVLGYLDAVDPPAAATARTNYSGCFIVAPSRNCAMRVAAVRDDLDARETDLVARSSQRAFEIAFHAASIAAVGFNESGMVPGYYAWRDENMAINALRLQQRRASNGRIILWGHQEHLGKTTNIEGSKPTGKWLEEKLGVGYFVVGSCSGEGSFNVVLTPPYITTSVVDFPSISALDYESSFRSAAMPLLFIPLHGSLPDWLSSPHQLRGGTSGAPYDKMETLPQKLDAILYIDRTTPSSSFW